MIFDLVTNIKSNYVPQAGDIILVDLGDIKNGCEQCGQRPAIVVSKRWISNTANIAWVIPISKKTKCLKSQYKLPTFIQTKGVALTEQLRSIDLNHRNAKYVENLPTSSLDEIKKKIGRIM